MPILVNLDVMMARRKISAGELAEAVGITPAAVAQTSRFLRRGMMVRYRHYAPQRQPRQPIGQPVTDQGGNQPDDRQ